MAINYNNLPTTTFSVSSHFGPRADPFTGKVKQHNGVDLRPYKLGATDDPVYSVMSGTVSRNSFDKTLGNCIVINHDNTVFTWYEHLRFRSPLSTGTTVRAAQIIGIMGTTGSSTGVHLHFGMQLFGKWVDPYKYLLAVKKLRWEDTKDMPIYDYMSQLTGDWKEAVEWAKKVKIINGVNTDRMGLRESEVKSIVFQYRDNKRRGTL